MQQTAFELLKATLKKNGLDGLCDPDTECGCGVDDFAPCGEVRSGCYPAKGNFDDGFYMLEAAQLPRAADSAVVCEKCGHIASYPTCGWCGNPIPRPPNR